MSRSALFPVALCALALFASPVRGAVAVSGEVVSGEFGGVTGDDMKDMKIDRITFDVTAGTTVNFDNLAWEIPPFDVNGDGEFTTADFQMNLYTGADTWLQSHDDGGLGSDGSINNLDGNFNYTFATAGTYYLAIGLLVFDKPDGVNGFRPDQVFLPSGTVHYDWRVTMTATDGTLSNVAVSTLGNPAPVPEPAALALIGGGALGLLLRRRRGKRCA